MNMKNKLLTLLVFAMTLQTQAADNEKVIASKINHVTVFMQGAQVHRKGSTLIPKGTSYIVFDNVSPFINGQSIQASGKGKFTIMDVQYRYHYPTPVEIKNELPTFIQRRIKVLEDSIELQALRLGNLREKQKAISTERNLIMNHPLMKGQGKPDSLDLLIDLVQYMKAQLVDIADRNLKLNILYSKLTKQDNSMKNRLRILQNYKSNKPIPKPEQPKHQVIVMVNASSAINGSIEINYAVGNAGWNAWYDIKAKGSGGKIDLVYKAAVYQNTGENWKNVDLTVSNANPIRSSTKPVLPVWYIDYYVHMERKKAKTSTLSGIYLKESKNLAKDEAEMIAIEDADMASDYTQKMRNFTSVEFDIDLPYNIESNGKVHFVTVAKHKLEATFEHFLVPKLDNDAFVMAHITDWENLDLLTGSANLYFGNTFVGRTVLDPDVVSDTLDLSMGRDQTIGVKRIKLKSQTKNRIIGGNKEYTASYQIVVRNNGINNVNLTLEDQLPKTTNDKIEIELIKNDGGKLNELNGLISWKMKIEPGKKRTVTFTYKITYPKDQKLSGL
jgi:uncharacterized protein (TIGR02231 family)